MATLVSFTNGNFTAAGTWELVDSTSLLNSEAANTALTTSFVSSSAFTPGAITIDAIAVKVFSRSASPTGTISVRLFNNTLAAAVAGTTVTINVSDIHADAGGWYVFKFSAPVLLLVANSYSVQATTSSATQVNLYRDATASNWSRMLRTTTTQAPAAADYLVVAGDFTAASTFSTYTVTMNETSAATVYGQIDCVSHGILSYGTTAATNYYLKMAGNLNVYSLGRFEMGTSGTPIPSSSTAKLEFACTTNVEFGIENRAGGVVNAYGNPITVSALLAADASAAATSLTTNVSTGWLSGDVIAIASTTRTASEAESKALTANAVGTTLTISAITNTHSGTSPTQAELINLTRNTKIFGTSTTNQSYINSVTTATAVFDSIEFYNMGSATANKRGLNFTTTTGSMLVNKCSFYDFTGASSIGVLNGASSNNFTITNNVFYLIGGNAISVVATTGTSWTVTGNISIRSTGTSFSVSDMAGTFSTNTATSSAGVGIAFGDLDFTGIVSGNIAHSNASNGINITNVTSTNTSTRKTIASSTSYNNNASGIALSNSFAFDLDTATLFGNLTANINFSSHCGNVVFKTITALGGFPFVCPVGVNFASDSSDLTFENSFFGAIIAHTTADVTVPASNTYLANTVFKNCYFGSTNEIINTATNMLVGSIIRSAKHDQIANNHKSFKRSGSITIDTTIFNNASPSARMNPANALIKLEDCNKKVALNSGQSVTIGVYVRKSSVGDGSAYNGNQPRLVLKSNPAVGVNSDTVIATMTAAAGTWELISGTSPAVTDNGVLEFVVDCDGTIGWINVDDWIAS